MNGESSGGADAVLPLEADALAAQGRALHERGNAAAAVAYYDRALALEPGALMVEIQRALALQAQGRLSDALRGYERALASSPNAAEAHFGRANTLFLLNRHEEALAGYDRVLAQWPDDAAVHGNRAMTLHMLGRFATALASHDRAVALAPQDAGYHSNRGITLKMLQWIGPALAAFDRALALDPGHPDAHWNKALALLLAGDFEQGWALYESGWRPGQRGARREFARPAWQGEALAGRTILLYAEQGYGDAIQFVRYARRVAALGARVIVEAWPPLVRLLRTLEGVHEIVPAGALLPPFDCHAALMSLPHLLGTRLGSIPSTAPYLRAETALRARWEARLGARRAPRVGIVWAGSPTHTNDVRRSLRLARLRAYLPAHLEYVSLQKDVPDADRAELAAWRELRHVGDMLGDFAETAALCTLLDVIVTVDTAMAHVGGALGCQTWVLLPYTPDWRWLLGRRDSPWYPSIRLYRQGEDCDWNAVLARVAADLAPRGAPAARA